MQVVHDRVAAAAGDEPAVDREGDDPGEGSATPRLAQNRRSVIAASMAPGIARTKALSTISMTVIEIVSAANASRSAVADRDARAEHGRSVSA